MTKTICRLMSVALLSLLFIGGTGQNAQAQDVSVSYQTFYDNLSPYGQWVSDNQYGNVWVPNEGGDFRPYGSRGHWVMTDYGNTWVSDDPWGWATYHYGRWTYDPYYGWVWIPGYEWAPAWVSWRFGDGNCGWAPLGPGAGVSYNCPASWWVFVEPRYMYAPDCYSHWRGPSYNGECLRRTNVVNNYYVDNGTHVRYNYGPRGEAIQAVTHQPVQVYHVSQTGRPGAASVSGHNVSLYRPMVNRATVSSARPTNVISAPRAIGAPHENSNISATKQPAFRQEVQNRTPGNTAANGQRPGTQGQPNNNRPQPQQQRPQPQQQQRPQPQQQQRPQPQQQQRPQPQQQQRPQPQQQQRPQPQQQQRPQPQQQQRPQPQQQQRPQPQQQQRPQPQQQRPQPQQQQRPQPQPQQQQRPQPMPQEHNEAPREAPHEGGGGRR